MASNDKTTKTPKTPRAAAEAIALQWEADAAEEEQEQAADRARRERDGVSDPSALLRACSSSAFSSGKISTLKHCAAALRTAIERADYAAQWARMDARHAREMGVESKIRAKLKARA